MQPDACEGKIKMKKPSTSVETLPKEGDELKLVIKNSYLLKGQHSPFSCPLAMAIHCVLGTEPSTTRSTQPVGVSYEAIRINYTFYNHNEETRQFLYDYDGEQYEGRKALARTIVLKLETHKELKGVKN